MKTTSKEQEVAKMWVYGHMTLTEASRKYGKSIIGTYMTIARSLRDVMLKERFGEHPWK